MSLPVKRPRQRAVFVSDVHLRSTHRHASALADFLDGLNTRRIYLLGHDGSVRRRLEPRRAPLRLAYAA